MSLNFEIEGLDQAINFFNTANLLVASKVKKETYKSGLKIESLAKLKSPVDTGRLRTSIQTILSNDSLTATIFSDVNYAIYVEFGRRPGKKPPIQSLESWAKRHNLSGLEYVIARSIGKKGIKPRPFLNPAYQSVKPLYISALKSLLKELEEG